MKYVWWTHPSEAEKHWIHIFFFSDVDFCVGGTKGNERDAAFKGKPDGKFTEFYVLCNLKMSVLHSKHMAKDFTVAGPFYCFIFSILLFPDTELNFFAVSASTNAQRSARSPCCIRFVSFISSGANWILIRLDQWIVSKSYWDPSRWTSGKTQNTMLFNNKPGWRAQNKVVFAKETVEFLLWLIQWGVQGKCAIQLLPLKGIIECVTFSHAAVAKTLQHHILTQQCFYSLPLLTGRRRLKRWPYLANGIYLSILLVDPEAATHNGAVKRARAGNAVMSRRARAARRR